MAAHQEHPDISPEVVERTFARPIEEIQQWLRDQAAAQRPDVERAITELGGRAAPPS